MKTEMLISLRMLDHPIHRVEAGVSEKFHLPAAFPGLHSWNF